MSAPRAFPVRTPGGGGATGGGGQRDKKSSSGAGARFAPKSARPDANSKGGAPPKRAAGGGVKRPHAATSDKPAKDSAAKSPAVRPGGGVAKKHHKQRKHGEVVVQAKKLWEELRRRDLPDADRDERTTRLIELLSGKVAEIVFKHDGSRIVQTAIKYGSPAQREPLMAELRGSILRLAENHYARHLCTKLFKYATAEQRQWMTAELYGSVARLVRHREASSVVEYVFTRTANAAQRTNLVCEFFGPEYALFKSDAVKSDALHELFSAHPEKRPLVLEALKGHVSALIDKALLQHCIVHKVLLVYLQHCDDSERSAIAQSLNEQLVHILHTPDGAHAASICVSVSTAKDRKAIVKSMKGLVMKIAQEPHGHVVLMRLLQSTDDTVLTGKSILCEVTADIGTLCTDKYGSQVLLQMLAPQSTYIQQSTRTLLAAPASNSKKDPAQRRRELCAHFVAPLLTHFVAAAPASVRCLESSVLLVEALNYSQSVSEHDDAVRSLLTAVADDVPSAFDPAVADTVLHHFTGSRLVKRLIQWSGADAMSGGGKSKAAVAASETPVLPVVSNVDISAFFAPLVLQRLSDALPSWAMLKSASFVVLALAECPHTAQPTAAALRPHLGKLSTGAEMGTRLLVERLGGTSAKNAAPASAKNAAPASAKKAVAKSIPVAAGNQAATPAKAPAATPAKMPTKQATSTARPAARLSSATTAALVENGAADATAGGRKKRDVASASDMPVNSPAAKASKQGPASAKRPSK